MNPFTRKREQGKACSSEKEPQIYQHLAYLSSADRTGCWGGGDCEL
jgi:hypothetical protein